MGRLFRPLLFFLARCTEGQLRRQNEFLKAENQMLRTRVPQRRVFLSRKERERLLKLGIWIVEPVRQLDATNSWHCSIDFLGR